MTPPKKAITPRRATSPNTKPEDRFFDQYVWHHRVHEHLGEKLRYFLLKVSPYNEDKLSTSLKRLMKDKNLSGLRAYRVFGRNDLMIRAWMDDTTYNEMRPLFHKYIEEGKVTLDAFQSDYIQQVEYRWYWEKTPPTDDALSNDAELLSNLMANQNIVARIESGKDADKDLFEKYETGGLVIHKPSTADTITFFICVRVPDGVIRPDDKERLVKEIKAEISGRGAFLYPEIDFTSGVICNLMIRARARAHDYFAIGDLIRWLSSQPHVASRETYLSLTARPLSGDTNLSLASFDALEPPDPKCKIIFPNPYHPNGPYPTRAWGEIADEVVTYLRSKRGFTPPKGLRTFLHDFLLGVLRGNNHDMASALTPIFPALERHLHDHHKGYIVALGLKVDEVYLAAEITGRQHIMLVNLFSIYFKAIKMASRPLKNPGKWDSFADVRNKPFHGRDYTWRDAANIIIDYWPEVQALLKEIHSVCNRPDTRPPDIFAD